jgi:hypothetical protein
VIDPDWYGCVVSAPRDVLRLSTKSIREIFATAAVRAYGETRSLGPLFGGTRLSRIGGTRSSLFGGTRLSRIGGTRLSGPLRNV